MNNSKKVFAGLVAISMTMGLAACGNSSDDSTAEETTATTTTGVTVEVNTEGLKEGEDELLADAMSQLADVELENKEVKWLAHYDINPSTTGESKKVELEMFEQKYGGTITYYPTTYENRYNDLSTNVLGGTGIDLFPGQDVNNLPKGIVSGMFQPVDDYIDLNSAIWQNTAAAMELMSFGGKHYQFVTAVTAEQVVLYNKATIEANGLDDPWELYEAGEWNWDTFKSMLLDFVDEDAGQYGLDGWYNEKALFLSAGVPFVSTDDDGNLVCNVNDATVEKAMNYQLDLYNNGLVLPLEQFGWSIQPQMMGEGNQLFYLIGTWGVQGDPETWETKIDPENLGIAPVPSPEGSDPYQSATLDGFVLCKGSANPEGAARFVECVLVANTDESAVAISDRKAMDDNEWSEEFLQRKKEIDDLARQYPVYDLAAGCSTDIASLTTDGGAEIGLRAAFHGVDWATNRESIGDTLIMLVDEVNTQLQEKAAEE
ncbi:MAG: extracellular solute-binding protein [Oscillospiraceae bacterium]|nr:extracellular solute-binding protein [Oscillospiraceae bacterium]